MSTVIAALKSFEQQLDDTPFTKTQKKVWILSAMGVLLDGFDFFIIGVALPLIAHDFHMNAATKGLVAVAAVAGAFFGALIFGQVADNIGRKGMFLVDIILFVVFSAASAAAWNPASLIVFRFILGVGIGADYPIGVSYIAECVPTRLRGCVACHAGVWRLARGGCCVDARRVAGERALASGARQLREGVEGGERAAGVPGDAEREELP